MNLSLGDIVLVSFPFTNFEFQKIRPALVISNPEESPDVILCGITSNKHSNSVFLQNSDLIEGKLPKNSFVKIDKIATFEKNLILKKVAQISKIKQQEVFEELCKILKP